MRSSNELLACYRKLVHLSESMLALASAGEWEQLIACEVDYLKAVEGVTQHMVSKALPPMLQLQIRDDIKQVLDNETRLKALLNDRMDRLRVMVDSSGNQRNISNTYGKISSNVLFPGDI